MQLVHASHQSWAGPRRSGGSGCKSAPGPKVIVPEADLFRAAANGLFIQLTKWAHFRIGQNWPKAFKSGRALPLRPADPLGLGVPNAGLAELIEQVGPKSSIGRRRSRRAPPAQIVSGDAEIRPRRANVARTGCLFNHLAGGGGNGQSGRRGPIGANPKSSDGAPSSPAKGLGGGSLFALD